MLIIYSGDDYSKSREEFILFKEKLKSNYQLIDLPEKDLLEIDKWLYDSNSLFTTKKAIFLENILTKKGILAYLKKFDDKKEDNLLVFWEKDLDSKILKFSFSKAKIYESKLSENIFKYLDAIFPGNLKNLSILLNSISENTIENIIFFMTVKRVKELIFIKNNIEPVKKLASWQIARLHKQADMFDNKKLIDLYEALYRIEVSYKNSKNFYSIKKSLDILFCYFI